MYCKAAPWQTVQVSVLQIQLCSTDLHVTSVFGRFATPNSKKLFFPPSGSPHTNQSLVFNHSRMKHIIKLNSRRPSGGSRPTLTSSLFEEASLWTSVISLSDCGREKSGDNRAYCPQLRTPGTVADSRGSLFINPQRRSRRTWCWWARMEIHPGFLYPELSTQDECFAILI